MQNWFSLEIWWQLLRWHHENPNNYFLCVCVCPDVCSRWEWEQCVSRTGYDVRYILMEILTAVTQLNPCKSFIQAGTHMLSKTTQRWACDTHKEGAITRYLCDKRVHANTYFLPGGDLKVTWTERQTVKAWVRENRVWESLHGYSSLSLRVFAFACEWVSHQIRALKHQQ